MKKALLLLTTIDSQKKAHRLAHILLQHRAAACVTILARGDSWYWWKEKIDHSREWLLLIKTSLQHQRRLAALLKRYHPYEVPELIALPVAWAEPRYLDWLHQNLAPRGAPWHK